MIRMFAVSIAISFFGAACTTTRMLTDVVLDNSVYAATNPVTTVKELVWRVPVPFDCVAVSDTKTIEEWLEKNAEAPVAGSLKLLFGGAEFFPALYKTLENAEESIDLQTYLFDNDDVAAEYVELLRRKAEEIPVRIMCDGVGTWSAGKITAPSQDADYEREFDDVHRALTDKGSPNLQLRRTPNLLLGSNHMKIIIADHRVAFTGGMNIGREYKVDFRDLMIECHGPLVERISREFERSWQCAVPFGEFIEACGCRKNEVHRERPSLSEGESEVWILLTEPFKKDIFKVQMAAIERVKKRIYVENPYLWDRQYVNALCAASQRGVDVRVTIPSETNSLIGNGGTLDMANRMFEAGVRVFTIPGFSHVKAAIYDDWVCVGSANYDHLSFSKNRELNFFLRENEFVNDIARSVFFAGWKEADEMHELFDLRFPARISSIASKSF